MSMTAELPLCMHCQWPLVLVILMQCT